LEQKLIITIMHGEQHIKINITYSECMFVALVIQHVLRIRSIILLSLAYLAMPHFSRLSTSNKLKVHTCFEILYILSK
jgi:hypothetical protein